MDLKSRIDKKLQNTDLNTSIETRIDMRGLVITLNNAILFESGSAEVKEKNRKVLLEIADGIRNINNYIRIEGHTDNIPIHSGIYPSNWELSTARAASVVRLFIEQGNISPDKLEAVGYGEYKPVANNSSNDSRAKNRRIEVIILSQRYNNLEK
jgi:Flagellar motor protein